MSLHTTRHFEQQWRSAWPTGATAAVHVRRCVPTWAPAGTATISLRDRLMDLVRWTTNDTYAAHYGLAHHRHDVLLTDVVANGAQCIVLTVRDPADRLSTFFTFDLFWGGSRLTRSIHHDLRSPADLVHALEPSVVNASKPLWPSKLQSFLEWAQHGPKVVVTRPCGERNCSSVQESVLNALQSSTADGWIPAQADLRCGAQGRHLQQVQHNHSVKHIRQARLAHHAQGTPVSREEKSGKGDPQGTGIRYGPPKSLCYGRGSQFLVPQLDYLLGLADHPEVDVHIVCTHRFNEDWRRVSEQITGLPPDQRHPEEMVTDWRAGPNLTVLAAKVRRETVKLTNRSDFFPPEAREFVRQCMFPQDMMLFQALCGSSQT